MLTIFNKKSSNFIEEFLNEIEEGMNKPDTIFSSITKTTDYLTGKESYDEDSKEHEINIAVPGFSKEDVSVEIEGEVMHISGETKNEKAKTFFSSSSFNHSRKIKNLDKDSVIVELKDGILIIKYKLKEEPKPDKIKIQIK